MNALLLILAVTAAAETKEEFPKGIIILDNGKEVAVCDGYSEDRGYAYSCTSGKRYVKLEGETDQWSVVPKKKKAKK